MTKQELIDHLKAYSRTYLDDAAAFELRDMPRNAQFAGGKSEAFATAAAWLEEMEA